MDFFLVSIFKLKTNPVIKARITRSVITSNADISCHRRRCMSVTFSKSSNSGFKAYQICALFSNCNARSHSKVRPSTLPNPQATQSTAATMQSFEYIMSGVNRATKQTVDNLDSASAMMKRISAVYPSCCATQYSSALSVLFNIPLE